MPQTDTQNNDTPTRTTTEQRSATKITATPAIHTVSKIVELLRPWELSDTNRFKTYQMMLLDDAVWSSIESRITSIEVAQSKPKLQYDKNSERSVYLKEFIEYCIYNMQKSTRQLGRDAAEMVYNGIAPFEIVTKIDKSGSAFNNMFVLDDLVYIDPLTLDKVKPFETVDGARKISYWRQLINSFADTDGSIRAKYSSGGVIKIDARKVAVASYAASSSRPLGTSPLDAAYEHWRSKRLIEEYLLMGINKDLAGTPILKVPLDLFNQAKDQSSDAYKTMTQLVEQMANLHASDSTYMLMPSDTFSDSGTGQAQYDIEFKGIDGNNKQFDLVAILEQKKKAIYNVLSASHLITGESGGGSYNLAESKISSSAFMSLRDCSIIEDMWNKKIIPMLLRLNGMNNELLTDIPTYKSGEIQPMSIDEFSKGINRVARLLPAKAEVGNKILERMGIDYRMPEDITPDEYRALLFEFSDPSKVGVSEGSSGQGRTQQNNSDTNTENAS